MKIATGRLPATIHGSATAVRWKLLMAGTAANNVTLPYCRRLFPVYHPATWAKNCVADQRCETEQALIDAAQNIDLRIELGFLARKLGLQFVVLGLQRHFAIPHLIKSTRTRESHSG